MADIIRTPIVEPDVATADVSIAFEKRTVLGVTTVQIHMRYKPPNADALTATFNLSDVTQPLRGQLVTALRDLFQNALSRLGFPP